MLRRSVRREGTVCPCPVWRRCSSPPNWCWTEMGRWVRSTEWLVRMRYISISIHSNVSVHHGVIYFLPAHNLHKFFTFIFLNFFLPFQIGILAWKMKMLTPHYPEGREIILIANDVTHLIGSFGPLEDELFKVHILASLCLQLFSL